MRGARYRISSPDIPHKGAQLICRRVSTSISRLNKFYFVVILLETTYVDPFCSYTYATVVDLGQMTASLDPAERVLDVVIIGAGISGLSAAYELQKNRPNIKFVILEAKGLF